MQFVLVSLFLIKLLHDCANGFPTSITYASKSSMRRQIYRFKHIKEQHKDDNTPKSIMSNHDFLQIKEPRLFTSDIFAILVACELMGLLDRLTNDGVQIILSPVTLESFSTLPILVERDCVLSICWIVSNLKDGFSDTDVSISSIVSFFSLVFFFHVCNAFLWGSNFDAGDSSKQILISWSVIRSFRLILTR